MNERTFRGDWVRHEVPHSPAGGGTHWDLIAWRKDKIHLGSVVLELMVLRDCNMKTVLGCCRLRAGSRNESAIKEKMSANLQSVQHRVSITELSIKYN